MGLANKSVVLYENTKVGEKWIIESGRRGFLVAVERVGRDGRSNPMCVRCAGAWKSHS